MGRYLAELGSGPTLLPTEPKARAKFEQAASIEYAQFDPIAHKIFKETLYKKVHGQPIDEERVKSLLPVLESKLDVYEVILSKQKYLAGDVRTVRSTFEKGKNDTDGVETSAGGYSRGPIPFTIL
jgi:glutathione S-transferase